MRKRGTNLLLASAMLLGATAPAFAQPAPRQTPKGWNYEIKDGKRVPKAL